MLICFLTLGLDTDASDDEIRKRYLELIRRHTPEKDPARFQVIADAYEKIKDRRTRIVHQVLGGMAISDPDPYLLALFRAARPEKRSPGLRELLSDAGLQERSF